MDHPLVQEAKQWLNSIGWEQEQGYDPEVYLNPEHTKLVWVDVDCSGGKEATEIQWDLMDNESDVLGEYPSLDHGMGLNSLKECFERFNLTNL